MSHWSFQRKLVTGVVLICVLAILASVVSVITARSLIMSMTKITARADSVASFGPESVGARGIEFDRELAALVMNREAARAKALAPALAEAKRSGSLLVLFSGAKIALMVLLCLIISVALTRSYGEQTAARAVAESGQTQARDTLSEVEAAGRLKDEFFTTVSHELRNPLAPILTWTQLLRSGTLDSEKTARALDVIERNVVSQTRLIDDIVDVSRVASGKFRLDVQSVDLVPVIRAAAEFHTPASEAKEIRLCLRLGEQSAVMSGDPERLQQVMSNLISNAIKFTPKGGEVEVVLQRADSDIEVEVRDNGIGIEPAFLPHVFEPFRQGTSGTTRRHGGLGLGLAIVRHIVELHGGQIAAHSGGPEQGASFIVRFPIPPPRAGATPPHGHPDTSPVS